MIDVKIKGVMHGMRSVIDSMTSRKFGTIINVSSIAGIKAFDNHLAYSATKFAVHGITETLR